MPVGEMVLAAWTWLMVVLAFRNVQMLGYGLRKLDELHRLCRKDIDAGREWLWRYQEYERRVGRRFVPMLLMFWRPLDSFYEHDFMRETPETHE